MIPVSQQLLIPVLYQMVIYISAERVNRSNTLIPPHTLCQLYHFSVSISSLFLYELSFLPAAPSPCINSLTPPSLPTTFQKPHNLHPATAFHIPHTSSAPPHTPLHHHTLHSPKTLRIPNTPLHPFTTHHFTQLSSLTSTHSPSHPNPFTFPHPSPPPHTP